jgi:hypothetical protein
MKSTRFSATAVLLAAISLCINACAANATTVALTPTSSPVPSTPTATLEPTVVPGVYRNDYAGISFAYPPEWQLSTYNQIISIANDEALLDPFAEIHEKGKFRINVWFTPLEQQAMGSPIAVLDNYTLFSDIEMPDQEPAHIVEINGREFAIGMYSDTYIQSRPGSSVPIFLAMHFTKQHTVLVEMYASPDEDEAPLRKILEDVLGSIESRPGTYTSYEFSPFEPKMLLSAEDLDGWIEGENNQEVISDGVCRQFRHESIPGHTLSNCVFYKPRSSLYYTPPDLSARMEEYHANSTNAFVDLTSKSRHAYESEHVIFAWLNEDGLPAYTILLDRNDLSYAVELATASFETGTEFEEAILEQFDDQVDDLLYDVVTKDLEKSKYPFDPAILASVDDLKGWESSATGVGSETVYSDSICRDFTSDIDYGYSDTFGLVFDALHNCVFYKTEERDPAVIRDYYKDDPESQFIDLKAKSKYTYDHDFELYAYDSGSFPSYELYLEKDGVIYSVKMTTTEFKPDIKFEDGILYQLENGIDDLLHEVIMMNLERNK